tara:strand:- start:132 stop:860 length:729 start_codon:yes stop_codon:yes gene_type:complete
MKTLEILSQEVKQLLEKNNLLFELIKREKKNEIIENINISKEEYTLLESEYIKSNKTNQEDLNKKLKNNNLSKSIFLDNISKPYKLDKFKKEKFQHRVESKFLSIKDGLDSVVYSLIRVKDKYESDELYLRLIGKESTFSDIAQEYSQGPEKIVKGIIGPIAINKGHPAVGEMLKSLNINEISKPFQVQDWWLIVRLESFEKATLNKEMENFLLQELFDEWLIEEANEIKGHIIGTNDSNYF